jgi:hypothetical protein
MTRHELELLKIVFEEAIGWHAECHGDAPDELWVAETVKLLEDNGVAISETTRRMITDTESRKQRRSFKLPKAASKTVTFRRPSPFKASK